MARNTRAISIRKPRTADELAALADQLATTPAPPVIRQQDYSRFVAFTQRLWNVGWGGRHIVGKLVELGEIKPEDRLNAEHAIYRMIRKWRQQKAR